MKTIITIKVAKGRVARSESVMAKAHAAYLAKVRAQEAEREAKELGKCVSVEQAVAMAALLE